MRQDLLKTTANTAQVQFKSQCGTNHNYMIFCVTQLCSQHGGSNACSNPELIRKRSKSNGNSNNESQVGFTPG